MRRGASFETENTIGAVPLPGGYRLLNKRPETETTQQKRGRIMHLRYGT